jgi:hypothetical protein
MGYTAICRCSIYERRAGELLITPYLIMHKSLSCIATSSLLQRESLPYIGSNDGFGPIGT